MGSATQEFLMRHVHVCLVSDQPIPNLTTSFQFKPDIVVLLTTKEMQYKKKDEFLVNVLKKHKFEVKKVLIDAYDINDVIARSEDLIKECGDCRLTLNITGGTKIGTLGTFQAFYTKDKEIYYVDTEDNIIIKLYPEKEQDKYPIDVTIPITDYLTAYGFFVKEYVKDTGYIYDKRRQELTRYLARRPDLLGELNYKLQPYDEDKLPDAVELPHDKNLFEKVLTLNGVSQKGEYKIEITDPDILRYLKGIWFEEYVYMLVKELGEADKVLLNVKGEWVTTRKHYPRNEFDILISKKNRLFYISCKTANLNRKTDTSDEGIGREALYELDSVADNALGIFGRRMIASARKIEDPYVRTRAEILNITIKDDIATLKEGLRQWLQK